MVSLLTTQQPRQRKGLPMVATRPTQPLTISEPISAVPNKDIRFLAQPNLAPLRTRHTITIFMEATRVVPKVVSLSVTITRQSASPTTS